MLGVSSTTNESQKDPRELFHTFRIRNYNLPQEVHILQPYNSSFTTQLYNQEPTSEPEVHNYVTWSDPGEAVVTILSHAEDLHLP
jgi:hypothetical protein